MKLGLKSNRPRSDVIRGRYGIISKNTIEIILYAPFSHVQLCVTPWTAAHQAHPSLGFSRQEYWNGSIPFSRAIFLTQESNPGLLHCRWVLYCLSHQGSPGKVLVFILSSFTSWSGSRGTCHRQRNRLVQRQVVHYSQPRGVA